MTINWTLELLDKQCTHISMNYAHVKVWDWFSEYTFHDMITSVFLLFKICTKLNVFYLTAVSVCCFIVKLAIDKDWWPNLKGVRIFISSVEDFATGSLTECIPQQAGH